MKQTYSTRDFYLASYLVYKDIQLITHRRSKGSTEFSFEQTDKLNDLTDEFYSMRAQINDALSFCSTIKNMKTIVHTNRAADHSISTFSSEELNNEFNNKQRGEK